MRTRFLSFNMSIITPAFFLFLRSIIGGVILIISSESWFRAWCGLELNLIAFIPFIRSKDNRYVSEASLKYFLIQALGSAIIISSAILFIINPHFIILLTLALLLKVGAAPFHFWFPQVIEGLNWLQRLILITIQKVGPLYLLVFTFVDWRSLLIKLSAILSALVGAVGGVNQTLLRKLLAFSSINHISWIIFRIIISENLWFTYFIFYTFIISSIVILFHTQKCFSLPQLISFNKPILDLIRFLSLLSLGGLPPFTGFIPKWIVLQEMIKHDQILAFLILLSSSLITLYFYLRVSVMFINIIFPRIKWNSKNNYINNISSFAILNLLGIIIPSLYFLI